MRASFTGEQGYEIYVPPKYALNLWERIFYYSRDVDLVPYGTETMHLLRAEKGYIIVGQETDGTVTPPRFKFELDDWEEKKKILSVKDP